MPEEVSKPTSDYLTNAYSVMCENDRFLREHARDTHDEIVEFINDAIDAVGSVVEAGKQGQLYSQSCMGFFAFHVLMPYSYAIYTDLLTGNLPVCFIQLRLILESLAKCYLADKSYPDETFFQSRLDHLYSEARDISKIAKQVGQAVGLNERFYVMWKRLSDDWVHTRGIGERIARHIAERGGIPAWSIVLPMDYKQDDLPAIDELRQEVAEFRVLLKTVMNKSYNLFTA